MAGGRLKRHARATARLSGPQSSPHYLHFHMRSARTQLHYENPQPVRGAQQLAHLSQKLFVFRHLAHAHCHQIRLHLNIFKKQKKKKKKIHKKQINYGDFVIVVVIFYRLFTLLFHYLKKKTLINFVGYIFLLLSNKMSKHSSFFSIFIYIYFFFFSF